DDEVLVLEAEAPVARRLMHGSPDQGRLVACLAQLLGQGRRRVPFDAVAESYHAMRRGELAREQGSPRGDAGRAGGIAAAEHDALAAEGVEIGRLHDRVACQ